MAMESKYCPDCGIDRPVAIFPKNKRTKDGYAGYCKHHHNKRTRESRERNGGARNYHLRRRYGITAVEFETMVAHQSGKCLICDREFTEDLRPVMDHDHETGALRGILCDPCNRGLGQFRHDVARIEAAAWYLKGGE